MGVDSYRRSKRAILQRDYARLDGRVKTLVEQLTLELDPYKKSDEYDYEKIKYLADDLVLAGLALRELKERLAAIVGDINE